MMKTITQSIIYRLGLAISIGSGLLLFWLGVVAPRSLAAEVTRREWAPLVAISSEHPAMIGQLQQLPPIAVPGSCYSEIRLVTITNNRSIVNEHPTISNEGSHIALISDSEDLNDPRADPIVEKEIYLWTETSSPRFSRLTTSDDNDDNGLPAINNEGTAIAFHSRGDWADGSNPDGNFEIFHFIISDTLILTSVTETPYAEHPALNSSPSMSGISATGKIVFVSDHNYAGENNNNRQQIFLAPFNNFQRDSLIQLTHTTGAVVYQVPAISGNGNYVAFLSTGNLAPSATRNNSDGSLEIFLARIDNPDDVSFTQVTSTTGNVFIGPPTINYAGTRIAFVSDGNLDPDTGNAGLNRKNREIFIYKTGQGGNIIQVTDTLSNVTNMDPDLSADGLRIAFASDAADLTSPTENNEDGNEEGNQEIFVARLDRDDFEQVTSTSEETVNRHPSIDQNGETIAFASNAATGANRGTTLNQEIFIARCNLVELEVSKSASSDTINFDQMLIYRLTITNNSTSEATSVMLVDHLPPDVEIVECSPDPCPVVDNEITYSFGTLAGGQSETVVITIRPTTLATLTNSATVESDEEDSNRENNTAVVTTPVRSIATLTMTKLVTPTSLIRGNPVVYTITISNKGPYTVPLLTLTDPLPVGIITPAVSSPNFQCQINANSVVNCALENMPPNISEMITITGVAATAATMTNRINVTSYAYREDNLARFPAPYGVAVTTTLLPANLWVRKLGPQEVIKAGERFTYTLTVANKTPAAPAVGVVVSDTLPEGIFDPDKVWLQPDSPTCQQEDGLVTCEFEELSEQTELTETVKVSVVPITGPATITNIVSVTAANEEVNPNNNRFTETTTLEAAADLAVLKTASSSVFTSGQPLTYTIVVSNNGPLPVEAITLTDILSAEAVISQVTSSLSGNCRPDQGKTITCTFTFGPLAPNAQQLIRLWVTPPERGTIVNNASVTGSFPDFELSNNEAGPVVAHSQEQHLFLPLIFKKGN